MINLFNCKNINAKQIKLNNNNKIENWIIRLFENCA